MKKDFKKQNLTASNQNSSCIKVYTMGEVIEELLHTNYVDIIMDKVLKFPVSEKDISQCKFSKLDVFSDKRHYYIF